MVFSETPRMMVERSLIVAEPFWAIKDRIAWCLSFICPLLGSLDCSRFVPCKTPGASAPGVCRVGGTRLESAASVGASRRLNCGSSYNAISRRSERVSVAIRSTFIGERRPPERAIESTLESARSSRERASRKVSGGAAAAVVNATAIASIWPFKDTESRKAGLTRPSALASLSAFLYINTLRMSLSNTFINIDLYRTISSELVSL